MISKVERGHDVAGLLRYLFSEGQANVHTNPRLIASWDGQPNRWEPAVLADRRRDVRVVAEALNEFLDVGPKFATPFGVDVGERPRGLVYHVSVGLQRADPAHGVEADPHLSDAQFAEITADLLARVDLPQQGVRWVAMRHDQPGETHCHVVATLACPDGRRLNPWNDYLKLGQGCQFWEAKLGLRRTAPRDGTGRRYPLQEEMKKAQRKQWRQPTRVVLQEKVRAVAGTAEGVDDFLRRLRDEGLLVRERHSPRDGSITGYAVAEQRPAKDGTVEQIWFSGGKLAADLTIPKLRQRWPSDAAGPQPRLLVDREEVWSWAANAVRKATDRVRSFASDPSSARQAAWEASDFLASLSRLVPGREGRVIRDAAWGFERAGYAALGPGEEPLRTGSGLREAARLLTVARFVPREDMRALLSLMAQLAVLAEAIERMRQEQDRAHQAEAARRAAHALRHTSPAVVPDEDAPPLQRQFTKLREMTL